MTGCLKANRVGKPGTDVYELEPPLPVPLTPPTLCFNALESSSANTRAVPNWHRGWHGFSWHGDGPLSEKEAFSFQRPERGCCTWSTVHRLTLFDIESPSGENIRDLNVFQGVFQKNIYLHF